jgi:16S rRNA (guanine1207-N2)-methyltransferase
MQEKQNPYFHFLIKDSDSAFRALLTRIHIRLNLLVHMTTADIMTHFSHKSVDFRYDGIGIKLHLSHALFSSFSVDAGSALLLKNVTETIDVPSCKNVLDTGCGTGVLGIALAKRHPHLQLYLEDRDYLATVFADHNASSNGVAPKSCTCSLSFDSVPISGMDLILFNVPAKAGDSVLKSMVQGCLRTLSPAGIAAIVIVNTLATRWQQFLNEEKAVICHMDKGHDHTVFSFRKGDTAPIEPLAFPGAYRRQDAEFEKLKLTTVYNIPGFDNPSFSDRMHFSVLEKIPAFASALIFGPGQGWLPIAVARQNPAVNLTLADRDVLALKISAKNVQEKCRSVHSIEICHPAFYAAPHAHDAIFLTLDRIPETDLDILTWQSLAAACTATGLLSVCGTSNDYNYFMKKKKGFSIIREYHKKGLRACLLKRQ